MNKRKRGRPRKPKISRVVAFVPFKQLPPGTPDADDVAELLRRYRKDRPHFNSDGGHLREWMEATAKALEAGDAFRVGWYAYGAIRQMFYATHQVEIETLPGQQKSIGELVEVGVRKLVSDKRRGSRGLWENFLELPDKNT